MKPKLTEWKFEDVVHTKSDFIRMVWAALEEHDTIFLYQTCMELVNIAQKKKWLSQK